MKSPRKATPILPVLCPAHERPQNRDICPKSAMSLRELVRLAAHPTILQGQPGVTRTGNGVQASSPVTVHHAIKSRAYLDHKPAWASSRSPRPIRGQRHSQPFVSREATLKGEGNGFSKNRNGPKGVRGLSTLTRASENLPQVIGASITRPQPFFLRHGSRPAHRARPRLIRQRPLSTPKD